MKEEVIANKMVEKTKEAGGEKTMERGTEWRFAFIITRPNMRSERVQP